MFQVKYSVYLYLVCIFTFSLASVRLCHLWGGVGEETNLKSSAMTPHQLPVLVIYTMTTSAMKP